MSQVVSLVLDKKKEINNKLEEAELGILSAISSTHSSRSQ